MIKYFNYLLENHLVKIIILVFLFTQFTQQDISVNFYHLNSESLFIKNYSAINNSILGYLLTLFDYFSFKPNHITIFISMIYSTISLSSLIIFSLYSERMNVSNLSFFIFIIFFLEKLELFSLGFNYPINILVPGFNTIGTIGLAFSLLTIITFLINQKYAYVLIIINLLIHPTLGLLTIAYIFIVNIQKRQYIDLLYLILITLTFLFYNYESSFSNNPYIVNFIHLNDLHRSPIKLTDLQFLFFPLFLSFLHKSRSDLIVDWVFIVISILISFIYYNLKVTFLELPVLALMPSRGANIGVAMIIIKSCADLIVNVQLKKLIYLLSFSIIYNQLFVNSVQMTSVFIGCVTGLILIIIGIIYKVELVPIHKKNIIFQVKKYYFILVLSSFTVYLNLLSAYPNINQNIYTKFRSYDQFFKTLVGKNLYLDFINDRWIIVKNDSMIPLLDLGAMDGFSWNPSIFNSGNKIFQTLFGKNLWEINLNNSACVRYPDVKIILEKYDYMQWNNIKSILKLDYILCPASSKIDLERIWEDENYVVFKL